LPKLDRLEQNTGEARRLVYDHVRAALRYRLNALDPPLGAHQIIAECVSLERAIHKHLIKRIEQASEILVNDFCGQRHLSGKYRRACSLTGVTTSFGAFRM
jgi:hypothetical protein